MKMSVTTPVLVFRLPNSLPTSMNTEPGAKPVATTLYTMFAPVSA